jgi:hypothetical protein
MNKLTLALPARYPSAFKAENNVVRHAQVREQGVGLEYH